MWAASQTKSVMALPVDMNSMVERIKEMQRTDPTAKEQWGAYCDNQGGGVRDPAKHDVIFLQDFLSRYRSGVRLESADKVNLALLFKEGQRKSHNWKRAWAAYCQLYGQGKNDPTKHDAQFLTGFLDYMGQQAAISLQMGGVLGIAGGATRPPKANSRIAAWQSGQAEGNYFVGSGDAVKEQLVQQVKSLQRSGPLQKQQWWDFCDNSLGGIRDPAKHTVSTLSRFLDMHGVI
eukprot:TRINITY_DN38610_c0_g1_i1.p1 TRINITY_DN38610_c0_g1~~TRINITY_DN38610_c0_g1_i1.p1  ORF type:complete len:233 (-),score=40.58 TRINITY_DN38610_c0_g1_i1:244-942(-)